MFKIVRMVYDSLSSIINYLCKGLILNSLVIANNEDYNSDSDNDINKSENGY